MFLNIITPCSRPYHLLTISKSINIPINSYRWIVVFDMSIFPPKKYIPDNCEIYLHKNPNSVMGNSQRNFGIDLVKTGHVYMNDDDTIIHPNLWENIKNLNNDFISFDQIWKTGKRRLKGNFIKPLYIDTHNYIVSNDLIGNDRWILNEKAADGYFARDMARKSKNPIYINKPLSIYNYLK